MLARGNRARYYALNIDYLVTPVGKLLLDLPESLLMIAKRKSFLLKLSVRC